MTEDEIREDNNKTDDKFGAFCLASLFLYIYFVFSNLK